VEYAKLFSVLKITFKKDYALGNFENFRDVKLKFLRRCNFVVWFSNSGTLLRSFHSTFEKQTRIKDI